MDTHQVETSVKGRVRPTPAINVDGHLIILRGKWLKKALVHDQFYIPNGIVTEPEPIISRLQQWSERPDIFEFAQKPTESFQRFNLPFFWDNMAMLTITDYAAWLATQAKRDVKENLRRARREGIVVRTCTFDDQFIQGIKNVYDETPLRQGRPFWHFGKTIEQIRREAGHYVERSEFIGAFVGAELVGFVKMVYVDDMAKTMYVIAKDSHFHRRPVNAMLAKAIEICATKNIRYFNYGPYDYPGKKYSSLTEFKKRHGFIRCDYPRYFVPLTWKGRVAIALGLHRGYKRLIPMWLVAVALDIRARAQHHVLLPIRLAFGRTASRSRRTRVEHSQ